MYSPVDLLILSLKHLHHFVESQCAEQSFFFFCVCVLCCITLARSSPFSTRLGIVQPVVLPLRSRTVSLSGTLLFPCASAFHPFPRFEIITMLCFFISISFVDVQKGKPLTPRAAVFKKKKEMRFIFHLMIFCVPTSFCSSHLLRKNIHGCSPE